MKKCERGFVRGESGFAQVVRRRAAERQAHSKSSSQPMRSPKSICNDLFTSI